MKRRDLSKVNDSDPDGVSLTQRSRTCEGYGQRSFSLGSFLLDDKVLHAVMTDIQRLSGPSCKFQAGEKKAR